MLFNRFSLSLRQQLLHFLPSILWNALDVAFAFFLDFLPVVPGF
jgi:hypothetical protein